MRRWQRTTPLLLAAAVLSGALLAAAQDLPPEGREPKQDSADSAATSGWLTPTYEKPFISLCSRLPCKNIPIRHKPAYKPAQPDPARDGMMCCQPGYGYVSDLEGFSGPMCIPCESGWYSPGGQSRCLSCGVGDGFVTPRGASRAGQCACRGGHGSDACTSCPPGTWSAGGFVGGAAATPRPPCLMCPSGTLGSSAAGAASEVDCGGCVPGHGGLECERCPEGSWSKGGSWAPCQQCGVYQTSPAGATGAEFCMCMRGTGADPTRSSCQPCALGTFNPGPATESKALTADLSLLLPASAVAGQPTITACKACNAPNPSGLFTTRAEGSGSVDECVCLPGAGGEFCNPCPVGWWGRGGSRAECVKCPGLSTTTSSQASKSPDDCVCPAGTAGAACEVCPVNTFSAGGKAAAVCEACPAHTVSPAGSVSSSACRPLPGFGFASDGSVAKCPPGTFSLGGELQPCTPCPPNTESPSGATDVTQCVCRAAYKPSPNFAADGCEACEYEVCPGGTSSGSGTLACPPGSYALPGTSSLDQCVCKPGSGWVGASGGCAPCAEGQFSLGGSRDACTSCPPGRTSPAGSLTRDACVCLAGRGGPTCALCVQGFFSVGGAAASAGCTACPAGSTTAGATVVGATDASHCEACLPGSAGPNCLPCTKTQVCPGGSRQPAQQCPPNTEVVSFEAISITQCVCSPGAGGVSGGGEAAPTCAACAVGTWSAGGSLQACRSCGVGRTTAAAAAVSEEQCVCQPGFGGADCSLCPADTWSTGFSRSNCSDCPSGSTSRAGATSAAECVCAAGHGGLGCEPCSEGTYSAGGSNAPCHVCGGECSSCGPGARGAGFTTLPASGATSSAACVCKTGYGGSRCEACTPGTWSAGGSTDVCQPCPDGKTSPAGSGSEASCVWTNCPPGQELVSAPGGLVHCACKPGRGFDAASGQCVVCPVNTWGLGGNLDSCRPCGFSFTSPAGSTSQADCRPAPQCPAGTRPLEGATSLEMCVCLPGHGGCSSCEKPSTSGACQLCPVGFFAAGGSLERARPACEPCPFGTTSPAGSTNASACVPAQRCPSGQEAPPGAVAVAQCTCKPGFGGSANGKECVLCPVGSYSPGGSFDPCLPCRAGTTSAAGSTSMTDCVPAAASCPAGQIAAPGSSRCACAAGWAGDASRKTCVLCAPGFYSKGGSFSQCLPCKPGTTSEMGAQDGSDCRPVSQCPVGMAPQPGGKATGGAAAACACKPGWAGNDGSASCSRCPIATYSEGGSHATCKACPPGMTSPPESVSVYDCRPAAADFGPGQVALPAGTADPTSQQCICRAGHAVDISGACSLCPAGSYSPGGNLTACLPCRAGFTSAPGADSLLDCSPLPAALR